MSAVQTKAKSTKQSVPAITRSTARSGWSMESRPGLQSGVLEADRPMGAYYSAGPALNLVTPSAAAEATGGSLNSGGGAFIGGGGGPVQFKLAIGQPGDHFEREADTAAERVTSRWKGKIHHPAWSSCDQPHEHCPGFARVERKRRVPWLR